MKLSAPHTIKNLFTYHHTELSILFLKKFKLFLVYRYREKKNLYISLTEVFIIQRTEFWEKFSSEIYEFLKDYYPYIRIIIISHHFSHLWMQMQRWPMKNKNVYKEQRFSLLYISVLSTLSCFAVMPCD